MSTSDESHHAEQISALQAQLASRLRIYEGRPVPPELAECEDAFRAAVSRLHADLDRVSSLNDPTATQRWIDEATGIHNLAVTANTLLFAERVSREQPWALQARFVRTFFGFRARVKQLMTEGTFAPLFQTDGGNVSTRQNRRDAWITAANAAREAHYDGWQIASEWEYKHRIITKVGNRRPRLTPKSGRSGLQ